MTWKMAGNWRETGGKVNYKDMWMLYASDLNKDSVIESTGFEIKLMN